MLIGIQTRFPASGRHVTFLAGLDLRRHFVAIIGGPSDKRFGRLAAVK